MLKINFILLEMTIVEVKLGRKYETLSMSVYV